MLKNRYLLVYKNTLSFIFKNSFVFLDFKNRSYYLTKLLYYNHILRKFDFYKSQ